MSGIVKAIAAFFIAAAVSLLITAYGQGLWGGLVFANLKFRPELPWAAPIMIALLAALILYLAGFGPPQATRKTRRRLLRWNAVPLPVFFQAIVAGVLSLVAFGGIWIATSDLVHIPPGITPSMRGIPISTALAFLVMSSIAAPVAEEAAFRGYAQGILERAWGWAPGAIVGSSLLFAAVHFTQGLDPAKLGLYFLAGVIFGTIAYLTNSLYAVMIVHGLGDIEGFLLLWPHDAHSHAMGGHDPLFVPALVAIAVFVPLAIVAFRRLANVRETSLLLPAYQG